MNRYFRIQLTIILLLFSIVLSFVIAFFDYNKLKDQVRRSHEAKIEMAEEKVVDSLHTIDQVYNLTDQQIAGKMEEHFGLMLEMYEENPDFDNWDFRGLKDQFGMDIYIIDDENTVLYSSFSEDIGLNFDDCCGSFGTLLHERRKSGVFHHDGMDIQQSSGEIKKFSYMSTPDQRYLFELGISLENDEVFKQFNFLTTIDTLTSDYEAISSIHVYSPSGLILGYSDSDGNAKRIADEMRPFFLEALREGVATEVVKVLDEEKVTYRYIPYVAAESRGLSTNRVVEIVFNDVELEGLLDFYRNEFITEMAIIIVGVGLFSVLLASFIAQPVHLAFHDSLTGLKNRAAFEAELSRRLRRRNNGLALMMIDIDNFKFVNDRLGHAKGDQVLKYTAKILEEEAGDRSVAARVGGDEFVVILPEKTKAEIREMAKRMIVKINREYEHLRTEIGVDVSISMGVAFTDGDTTLEILYDQADQALYRSKENGKNQYTIHGVFPEV